MTRQDPVKKRNEDLATHLENIVEDETGHFEETEKILRGW
jgi:hypothetical protein